jgi:ketosteroid isomerase-like protein
LDSDIDAIKSANQSFYATLAARDISAMDKVWGHKPYAIYIGPVSKAMSIGYEAVRKSWEAGFDRFSKITVSTEIVQVQTDGKLAWSVTTENADLQPKAGGAPLKFSTFVTHVFEKEGDRWVLVSHHAQMIPK